MLVCTHCGTLKNEYELDYVTESHGERHCDYNCSCGGEFVEAKRCSVCDEWFDNTGLYGVCEECLEEHETVATAIKVGAEATKKVDVNGFFADILTPEMINSILEKWVEENFVDHSKAVVDYLEADKSAYSEYIESLE